MSPPGVVPPGGTHILLDLYGGEALGDLEIVRRICMAAAKATGATVIGENFHHFGEGCGISGVVLLAESHLSIHTWPDHKDRIATIDVYVCGDCDASKALPVLLEGFGYRSYSVIEIQRVPRRRPSPAIRWKHSYLNVDGAARQGSFR